MTVEDRDSRRMPAPRLLENTPDGSAQRQLTAAREVRDARDAAVREHSRALTELYQLARNDEQRYPGITVIRDRDRLFQRYQWIQRTARQRLRLLDSPPYYGNADAALVRQQLALQAERMAAGVEYRTIYTDSTLRHPRFGPVSPIIDRGELARSLPNLPMKLAVSDESAAVLSLAPTNGVDGPALVLHPSGLLTALVATFDLLWRLAMPVDGAAQPDRPTQVAVAEPVQEDVLEERDRSILMLMSAGATDEAIARKLHISRRTVVRRTSALLLRLGAGNRFQAGVQAARLGWL
ncbi:MAG TPA: LuxR C-terminal-related transcriptional regulator [Pseudonocardiaceae bacterium]|nr:LuxR C-terminal-related transcriptional regulator [Pseudonocardiaceae bacterium]